MADIASPLELARQAIAAAKTAADEGEAILRRTQERYRLNLHPRGAGGTSAFDQTKADN
jgi:hypothetical protein